MNKQRRKFLRQLAGAGTALPLAILTARHSFAQALESLNLHDIPPDALGSMRDLYVLGDEVNYLNHASIGTMPRMVFDARAKYLELCETNPWAHIWGGEWEDPREEVRRQCADFINCEAEEVALTHNTTEIFNVLANGLPLTVGDEVLFSSLNHPGASVAFELMAKRRGFSVKRFDFPIADVSGMSSTDVVEIYTRRITDKTKLLVFPHIDNIVGLRYPVAKLAMAARDRGVKYIAVDAAQSVGMLPVDVAGMGVDVYATSGHKWLQAPKGLGLAFIDKHFQSQLPPMWVTWGQDNWHESARKYEDYGTRNLAEVLTLGDALTFHRQIGFAKREQRLKALWQHVKTLADQHKHVYWISPRNWDLGSAICGIGLMRGDAKEVAHRLFQDYRTVVRGFTSQDLNSIRLSPNIFSTKQEVERLFSHV